MVRLQVEGFGRRMKATGPPANPRANLSQAVRESGWPAACRELFESEIHGQLADLGLPLYVTTNSDNFMALALESRLGRPARREGVAWREVLSPDAARPHHDLNPPATPENPVVLHLFGTDEDLCSLVLTEDDYLDYLAHISRDYEYLLPTSVNAALASTTLLFLGFRLDDLDLKVILRGLLANLDLRRWRVLRVAVQIEAEVVDQSRLDEVTSYFQRYFREIRDSGLLGQRAAIRLGTPCPMAGVPPWMIRRGWTSQRQRLHAVGAAVSKRPNPYVGPRPFGERDQNNFFGRDDEARQLTGLIIAHRAVLLYAQSGAGKTSLLRAKVIPRSATAPTPRSSSSAV